MIFSSKVVKIGGSDYILVPKIVRLEEGIVTNDKVRVRVIKVDGLNLMRRYKCKKCHLVFESDEEIPYCPVCGSKEIDETYIELEGGEEDE